MGGKINEWMCGCINEWKWRGKKNNNDNEII